MFQAGEIYVLLPLFMNFPFSIFSGAFLSAKMKTFFIHPDIGYGFYYFASSVDADALLETRL